jgi:hypothetical protein
MRSPFSYIVGSTYVLLLSLVPALAPAMAEEGFIPAHRYPRAAELAGINSCIARGKNTDPEIMRQVCICISLAMQDRYSLAQLIDLQREMKATRTLPEGVREISVGCGLAVLKANSRR